jgi:hypothetical protein
MVENEQQQPMVKEASNGLFNLDMFTPPLVTVVKS